VHRSHALSSIRVHLRSSAFIFGSISESMNV
jgi:hypothetical protein